MTIKGKGRNKGSKKQETRKRANEKEKSTVSKKGMSTSNYIDYLVMFDVTFLRLKC